MGEAVGGALAGVGGSLRPGLRSCCGASNNKVHPGYHKRPMVVASKSLDIGSNHNWIPEDIRRRMISRDLNLAKENRELEEICRASSGLKELKRRKSTLATLERCRSKEKYGIERRRPCGLCGFPFLPINLIMAVPLKAVLDIRDSWGDRYDPGGQDRVRVNPNHRRAPACYDQTRVCAFCSQLFDRQQDAYRPSWEAREAERDRMREEEEEAMQRVMSDPLAQIQRGRKEELTRALHMSEGGFEEEGGGGGIWESPCRTGEAAMQACTCYQEVRRLPDCQ